MKRPPTEKPKFLRHSIASIAPLAFLTTTIACQAQSGPFSPTNWPGTIDQNATVDYGIFDNNASFTTPAGWNQTLTLAGGGDQTVQTITLGGLTGQQSTSTYLNIADSAYTTWANVSALDILLEVYGNGTLYHADDSGISINFLEGTLLSSPPNNLFGAPAGLTPPGANNSQWNWMLLSITNPISPITGERYVGFLPSNAAGGIQNGGVNGGTLRLQNVPGIIVRAIAIGPQGAFGSSNQVNVFASKQACPPEPAVNLAFVDINARITNNLVVLNNGDQTVTYQSNVGPVNDRRTAVQATASFMNFGILSNYLGAPCNSPRPMKVCLEVYDDPALTGASFGPELYANDDTGDTTSYTGPMYTLQGSGQWLRVAFWVPNVCLAGVNTAPLTGGPRLAFSGGMPFFDRIELGITRTGSNPLAGQDPDPTFYLDPAVCSTNYGIYAELDLQAGITNNLDVGNSGGDQLMVVELAGPPGDQRLSVRPDGIFNNIQFAIQNQVFGPTYQDNARVAQVLTYYDDPALIGATLYPQVYQSWVGGLSTLKFPNHDAVAVTLQGSGKWLDAYFELSDANFAGVNQGPQSLVRYETTPAKNGDPTTGFVHVSRVRYSVIRTCGSSAELNVLQTNKPFAEFGDQVAGFQDNFSGATRNTNWVAMGDGGDNYLQEGGVLKVFANHGDPNHLVYQLPGYTNDVQEVLARVRTVAFGKGDSFRGGIGLAIGTNSQGINLLFRDHTNDAPASSSALRHFKLLDDERSWGPTNLTNDWANNVWYWLRLRQEPKMDGSNTVFGKVWLADWSTPEPADWQLTWLDSALPAPHRNGYAGLTASSSDAVAQFEVSYILIKAAGLPNITPSASPAAPPMQPPFFITSGVSKGSGGNVSVNWFGPASLVAAPTLSGPWTNIVSTTNQYSTSSSSLKPAEFYRLLY